MTGRAQLRAEMETVSGRLVDFQFPLPEQIDLGDVATGLANTCRFGGQCSRFYSVAEHAVLVARKLVEEGHGELAMAGLHHDDHEAYVGDLPRPLKELLRRDSDSWRLVEEGLQDAVALALGLGFADEADGLVRAADDWALRLEASRLQASGGANLVGCAEPRWPVEPPPPYWACGLSPVAARELWLYWHHQLTLRTP